MIFLDASAIVKAYVPEPGSPSVQGVIARRRDRLFLTRAVALEVLSTLAKKRRSHQLTRRQYQLARAAFLAELDVRYKLLELRDAEFTAAFQLVDAYRQAG